MDMTPRLNLPYIAPQQAQKQVTYNEAMRALDVLVHPVLKSRTIATPPGSPAAGDAYLVAAAPTGAWSGKAGKIAAFVDGGWMFHAPLDGWLLYVEDDDQFVRRQAGVWSPLVTALTDLSGYAEGSWTPGLTFGGAAVGIAFGAGNAGRYTRIGRLCIATFLLQLTSKGSSSGTALLTGLPFASITSTTLATLSAGWASGIAGVSGAVQGAVTSNATTVALYSSAGGASSALGSGNFSNSAQLQGVVIYDVA
ncbi:MAG: DUF2793 domain-containing protein [Hyphomicrobiales bacterium]|nr:MAG: DUF2793 domain-containing protein [Hyphomicrobiales bacterium]